MGSNAVFKAVFVPNNTGLYFACLVNQV